MAATALTALRRFAFTLLGIVLLLAILFAGLWASRERSLPPLINLVAGAAYGFTVKELQGLAWSSDRLRISRMVLVTDPGGDQLTVEHLDVRLSLWPIEIITAEVASLHLVPAAISADTTSSSTDTTSSQTVGALLDMAWAVPVSRIRLSQVAVQDVDAVLEMTLGRIDNRLQLSVSEIRNEVTATVTLLPQRTASLKPVRHVCQGWCSAVIWRGKAITTH